MMTLVLATLGLLACAAPKGNVVAVDVDSEGERPRQPAERVYDPTTYSYYWERDGERVSGKYD